MHFCSIESGSKGNSYIVRTEETVVLVDVGISGRKIVAGLQAMGLSPEDVDAVLLTHEHSDHAKSTRIILNKCPKAKLYTSQGTWDGLYDPPEADRFVPIEKGEEFKLGDMEVKSFPIHHDAIDPLGFSIKSRGRKLAIVTDTGFVCEDIKAEIRDADLIMLESNHDEDMLAVGRYPYHLKRRIAGQLGHLSNIAAAECLCQLFRDCQPLNRKKTIILAHMSQENNTEDLAELTIKSRLSRESITACGMFEIRLARQTEMSEVFEV